LTAITLIDVKSFTIDLFTSKLKRFGYKTAFFVLLGPYLQIASLSVYMIGGARKIRLIALTLSDIGSKISAGEMNAMNWMWIGSDLLLFGEPVPILNSTDLMFFRNESSVFDDILEGVD
jgi:hypothetical protein